MAGHPIESLGDVADAMREALKKHPEGSDAAVREVDRRLREQAQNRGRK